MTTQTTVHEIVQFSFRADVPVGQQRAYMAGISAFVRAQPGFLARQYFFSEDTQRWVDLVVWRDLAAARAASEAMMADAAMSPCVQAIDMSSISFGHYDRIGELAA